MHRPRIERIRLVAEGSRGALPDTHRLADEHPSVEIALASGPGVTDAIIDGAAWLALEGFGSFDDAVARSPSNTITVRAAPRIVSEVAVEVLTRWQRCIGRRNDSSATPLFDAVLRAHAALHDVSKPLVSADLDHAIDTWQWMLRLDPRASLPAQIAALFHDVERLESEPDRRVEQHAPDYAAFKDRHAARGAELAREVILSAGVDAGVADRVRALVASHERRGQDAEIDLLNDADALSFFSLNSAGYADYFGPAQTRKKVAYSLRRLGGGARARLGAVRLRPDVRAHLLASEARA